MREGRIVRADERFVTRSDGITSWHCFSYGDHYDPRNVGFGALRAVNEELLAPGAGYAPHRHRDVEIVTWVLEGVLAHEDSTGRRNHVRPGEVQRVRAGTGIAHTERNGSSTEPTRFVQMLLEDSEGSEDNENNGAPSYDLHEVEGSRGRLLPAVTLRPGVRMLVAMLDPGDQVTVPGAGRVHVHVTRGAVSIDEDRLEVGDTMRIASDGAVDVTAQAASEMLVWHLTVSEGTSP